MSAVPIAKPPNAESVGEFFLAAQGMKPLCNWVRALLEPVRGAIAQRGSGKIRLTILIDSRNVSVSSGPVEG